MKEKALFFFWHSSTSSRVIIMFWWRTVWCQASQSVYTLKVTDTEKAIAQERTGCSFFRISITTYWKRIPTSSEVTYSSPDRSFMSECSRGRGEVLCPPCKWGNAGHDLISLGKTVSVVLKHRYADLLCVYLRFLCNQANKQVQMP